MPFTAEQFFQVFARYNLTVFPAQIALVLLAVAAVFAARRETAAGDRAAAAILGFFWLWMGLVYHLAFFTAINPAAYPFAAFFVLEGLLFFAFAGSRRRLRFRSGGDARGIAGAALVIFALIAYPFIGHLAGHIFPLNPTFGLPCPTTIFTCGLLLWSRSRAAGLVAAVPLVWTAIGGSAAFYLGVWEDLGLLAAGAASAVLMARSRDRLKEIL